MTVARGHQRAGGCISPISERFRLELMEENRNATTAERAALIWVGLADLTNGVLHQVDRRYVPNITAWCRFKLHLIESCVATHPILAKPVQAAPIRRHS